MALKQILQTKLKRLKLGYDIAHVKVPQTIVIFVTNQCNFKCGHCFFHESINADQTDLTLKEYMQIADCFRENTSLIITGGEPFLRPDLPDIIEIFARSKKVTGISINTNAFFEEKIISFLGKFKKPNHLSLRIQVSLDGFEKTHDSIRGVKGAFSSAVKMMKTISSQYKDVGVIASSTIHKKNIEEILELSEYLKNEGIRHKYTVMRGNSFSTFGLEEKIMSSSDPLNDELSLTSDDICNFVRQCKEKRVASLTNYQELKLKVIAEILRQKRRVIPCYAGIFDGVIYANGDMSFCEQIVPVGNLRSFSYDLSRMWASEEAVEMRKKITKCACIHGCNMSTSIGKNSFSRIDFPGLDWE